MKKQQILLFVLALGAAFTLSQCITVAPPSGGHHHNSGHHNSGHHGHHADAVDCEEDAVDCDE